MYWAAEQSHRLVLGAQVAPGTRPWWMSRLQEPERLVVKQWKPETLARRLRPILMRHPPLTRLLRLRQTRMGLPLLLLVPPLTAQRQPPTPILMRSQRTRTRRR